MRRRRSPAPTRLGVALGLVLLVLLAGLGLGLTRADEERFEPASRSSRPAVLERAEVEDLAAEVFGPELAAYVASIARCESANRPDADANWPYVGLLQVNPYLHHARVGAVVGYPVTPADAAELLRDPRVNLMTAVLILRVQGWGAWPVCAR